MSRAVVSMADPVLFRQTERMRLLADGVEVLRATRAWQRPDRGGQMGFEARNLTHRLLFFRLDSTLDWFSEYTTNHTTNISVVM